MDCFKAFAIVEGSVSDACNRVGDVDASEIFATGKRIIANACDGAGNRDARELFVIVEHPIADSCDAVGDSDFSIVASVFGKCAVFDYKIINVAHFVSPLYEKVGCCSANIIVSKFTQRCKSKNG